MIKFRHVLLIAIICIVTALVDTLIRREAREKRQAAETKPAVSIEMKYDTTTQPN